MKNGILVKVEFLLSIKIEILKKNVEKRCLIQIKIEQIKEEIKIQNKTYVDQVTKVLKAKREAKLKDLTHETI